MIFNCFQKVKCLSRYSTVICYLIVEYVIQKRICGKATFKFEFCDVIFAISDVIRLHLDLEVRIPGKTLNLF